MRVMFAGDRDPRRARLVRASIRPERRDRWLELIRRNAADTRLEAGCESYEVSEGLERPSTFAIVLANAGVSG